MTRAYHIWVFLTLFLSSCGFIVDKNMNPRIPKGSFYAGFPGQKAKDLNDHHPLNTDSYSIYIGKKQIYLRYELSGADTIEVKRSLFNESDTLFAQHYQCGGMSNGTPTQICLLNQSGELLPGEFNTDGVLSYKAGIPIKTISNKWKLEDISLLTVSLVIRPNQEALGRSQRIGILRLVD